MLSNSVNVIQNEEAMVAFGSQVSAELKAGCVLALVGDLGAGKTHFSKGIVAGLEADDQVTSPTFSLVNEYRGGSIPIFHFDFYRLDSVEELEQIGWDEYLYEDGILLVEWADKYPESMPDDTIWCRFEVNKDSSRTVTIDGL